MHDVFDTLTIPVPFRVQSDEPLYTDNQVKNLLSQYLRYSLRAYSRYEGLFSELSEPLTSKQPYDKQFADDDLLDLNSPVVKLRGADVLAVFLRTQLGPDTLALLNVPAPSATQLRALLVRDFWKMVNGPSIYSQDRFPDAKLFPETIALRDQQPVGEGQLRLNRITSSAV